MLTDEMRSDLIDVFKGNAPPYLMRGTSFPRDLFRPIPGMGMGFSGKGGEGEGGGRRKD